jgi:hypothetical protein
MGTATIRREAHRQSLVVAIAPGENADHAFIDAVSEHSSASYWGARDTTSVPIHSRGGYEE